MARWPGTWRAVCQVCGFEFASDEIKKRWDGLLVCSKDYETRHPQTLIKIREESSVPAFVSSEPEDVFVHFCDIFDSSSYAGMAEAGCGRASVISPTYETLLDLSTNGHETRTLIADATTPTAYRYWRLYVTQNNGVNAYTSMGEFYLYDGATNRLPSAIGFYDSSHFGSNTAERLVDGGSPEEWVTENGQAIPCWVSFDLGAAYIISSYAIMSQHVEGGRTPATWELQANNTGPGDTETWTTIDTQSGEFSWDLLETRTYTIS